MNLEREAVLRYLDNKIEATTRRANEASTKTDHKYDLRISAHTLGILAGDLRAGLHETDPVPTPEGLDETGSERN